MDPLTAIIATGLLGAGAQYLGSKKQDAHNKKQAAANKADLRRAAIERAMGGTSFTRLPTVVEPPDLSNYGLVSGLANVAGQYFGRKL